MHCKSAEDNKQFFLSSLSANASWSKCEKLRIFQALRFYVKSISMNWFHVKCDWQKNFSNFNTVVTCIVKSFSTDFSSKMISRKTWKTNIFSNCFTDKCKQVWKFAFYVKSAISTDWDALNIDFDELLHFLKAYINQK